ncbi:unnamed protein product (macronuclear) [Paramecium tetraurelia]|uniref:EGF-like domain-containing protein n=1 Tax=Paramecium tetraurelia TaxID=5888 RepID=A0BFE7_PARTE|nr:uncharacterized protein GSPATT00028299001 [Paramecium tetraurelia]CAK57264.1 unnamed protein product [Paramecium tetraurelia]|eukprot:XP_001424662.1 hypothetical protein (macronuclear) [Paramecium tetraurelia strain d4-2]
MIFTLLTTLLFYALGADTNEVELYQIKIQDVSLDWSTKTISLDEQTLIFTKHFRTYESKYQIELGLLDIYKNELIKKVQVGNSNLENYQPQIILINNFIYVVYVSQNLSIVKLGLKKYDLNLVEQQVEYSFGDSLEAAKFDTKKKYIDLTPLNNTAFSIIWKSIGQTVNQYQWNYIKYDAKSDKPSQALTFPDSYDIAIAQNLLGTIGIVQLFKQVISITKIEDDQISNVISLPTNYYFNEDYGTINIVALPNGEFIICQYDMDFAFTLFDRDFNWKLNKITNSGPNSCENYQLRKSLFQQEYDLFLFSQGYDSLCYTQYDLSNNSFNIKQNRKIIKPYFWTQTYHQRIDQLGFNRFSIKWLSYNNYIYELSTIKIDMNVKQNECKPNCKLCDPQFKCLTCQDGYTFVSVKNECVPKCPDNCDTCSEPSYCIKCKTGFQYTPENLCVTPQNIINELRISDEQQQKGQIKVSVKDNEILILYSLIENNKQTKLVLKRLNSQGALIKQIQIEQQPNEIIDFDIFSVDDMQQFRVIINWLTVDSIVQIIDYQYDFETMQVLQQKTIDIQQQKLISIRIAQLKNSDVYYFYVVQKVNDNNQQYYSLSFLKIDDQGVYSSQTVYQDIYIIRSFDIQVSQNSLYFNFTNQNYLYQYKIEQVQLTFITTTGLTFDNKLLNSYDSAIIKFDYDEYLNKQIYINFTSTNPLQVLQATQSSRNIKKVSSSRFGQSYAVLAWIGFSNVELQNPVSQVFTQIVNLQTAQLTNFKELVCTQSCNSCTDQGICLECKNTKYQLQNGKCVLTCENNCELCETENQCLQCSNGFYLNENLLCDQTQEQDIYYQDNLILTYIASYDDQILQVSLKKNSSRYDIVFEAQNRQGQSKSGEIRISSDQDIVLFNRPKVLKVNDQIVIQYIMRNQNQQNVGQFVILNNEYISINSFSTQGELYGNEDILDFISTDDNKIHILYSYYHYSYWEGEYIVLKYDQYSMSQSGNPQLSKTQGRYLTRIDKQQKVRNIQIMKNLELQKLTASYLYTEDNIETFKVMYVNEVLDYFWLDTQEKFEYYFNDFFIWIVSYEKVNSNLVKVKFYNQNQELQQEHTIESQKQLNNFQIVLQPKFIYFIYTEQSTTTSNMNIQVIKYSLNGEQLTSRSLYHNELIIQGLSTSSYDDLLYLTWSSFTNNRIFKVRLNSELNTIPFVEQTCNTNCEICDSNLICTQCASDYQQNEQTKKCEPICAENCFSCKQPYTCDYCNGNSKFIDQKCRSLSDLQLETPICKDSCYGLPSIITFSDETTIYSYQKYENSQYKININIKYQTQTSLLQDQNLLSQDQEIAYHYLYLYEENQIALIWLSGNCQIQCRLMLQLFQKDLQVLSNPYELRIMKVKVSKFNLQIQKYNNNMLLLWTELDLNDMSQTMVGEYSMTNGFSLKSNINQNENDASSFATLIIQSGYYQIIYVKNNLIINSLTVDGSTNTYKVLYTSKRPITSLAVANSYYYGSVINWVEQEEISLYISYNYLYYQWFDQNLNARGSYTNLLKSVQQITQLAASNSQNYYGYFLSFVYQEFSGQYRIRYKFLNIDYSYQNLQLEDFAIGNALSQYTFDYGYRIYKQPNSLIVIFSGFVGSSQQLFYLEAQQSSSPVSNCFQRNIKQECVLCRQGYYLFENECELDLPQHCIDGTDGICEVCDLGYKLTSDHVCQLDDQRYKEMKMNAYVLQSKQRITTFKNGDYVTVWYRQYYENQGTGVFMSMFNAHGKKILEEKRISLSFAGIQIYPDVQALDNDQFCAVWIEGDLQVQAKIKLQRFTKDFVRVGDEIIVKENVQLKHAQRFDTPIMIQSIVNGYVIVWTQNYVESNRIVEKLHVVFYDLQDKQQGFFVLNKQESIINSEPVVASNDQIIVIVWQSDFGIIASKFSLNYVYISQQILSENGQAPTIGVLSDNKFIIAWRETFINSNDFMSQSIMYRKYTNDLNTWEFSNQIIIPDHNLNNPDVLATLKGFAIIFENRHAMMSDLRNLKMQLFNLDGFQITQIIDVYNEWNLYPHHPQLTQLPQGEFLVSWTLSLLQEASFQDDLYMKRYNSEGLQLPMDTVVCPQNCLQCNESDVCQVCQKDYVLNNKACVSSIPHCTAYLANSVELVCQTCEAEYQLTQNICFQVSKLKQLNVEFVKDITSKFAIVKFTNSDMLFIWQEQDKLMFQKFDQYGKQYYVAKQNQDVGRLQMVVFDACEIENNYFIIVYQNFREQEIQLKVYDEKETLLIQRMQQINQLSTSTVQFLILKHLGNNKIAMIYQVQQDQKTSTQLYMKFIKITGQNGGIDISFQQQSILVLQMEQQSSSQSIDVQIVGNYIKICIENVQKSEIRYIYKIYDFFGNLVKTITKKNDNTQVEFKLMELEDGSFLEVWTEISYSKYEVFYVVKANNNNLFEPKKLSTSSEFYKLDLKTHMLSDSIAVIWREGSYKGDMTANTIYKTVLISKEDYKKITNPQQLNSDSFVKQGVDNYLQIIQLSNQDIVIGWISYNFQAKSNAISAIKLNQIGEILDFSQYRCSNGCQECTNLGKCIKCYDEDKYILNQLGNCIIKQAQCKNYKTDCQNCLDGFYRNRYNQCNEIKQNVEIDFLLINLYSYDSYKVASYKNGTVIVTQKNTDKSIGIRVVSSDGTLLKDNQMITEITQDPQVPFDQTILHFQVMIDDKDVLTYAYIVGSQYQNYYLYYVVEQFDDQFNRIGDRRITYLNGNSYSSSTFILKNLQNTLIGVAVKVERTVLFSVYTSDLSQLIGNVAIPTNDQFEFISNGEYILYGYVEWQCNVNYQSCTVIKVYDKQLRFIKDIQINDAQYIKMTINDQKQFIVLTKSQINIIDKAQLIKSSPIIQQMSLPLQIFLNQNSELVIFSYDEQNIRSLQLTTFSIDGQVKREIQVNIKALEYGIYGLFQLQNTDIIILFSGQQFEPTTYTNKPYIRLARFDQFGESQSAIQIVCPQNCELCYQESTCNICKPGYNRNEQTLLCQKICTIEGCQSCENSNCDVCKDGMFFSFDGRCVALVQDPTIDEKVRYTIDKQFYQEIRKKVLKFSNNEFALIYQAYDFVRFQRFNAQGKELLVSDFNVNAQILSLDAAIVKDQIYIIIVTVLEPQSYQVYYYFETLKSFKLLFTNQLPYQITSATIKAFSSSYVILVTSYDNYYFDFAYMQCLTQSLYFYDQSNLLIDSKVNFNNPTPLTYGDCNINKINNLYIFGDILYTIIISQTQLRMIALNYLGQNYGEVPLDIPNIEQIEFTLDSEIVILFKQIGTQAWNLRIMNTQFQTLFNLDNYLRGDLSVSMVTTNSNIVIAWSQKNKQSIVEFVVLDRQGTKIKSNYINGQYSSLPLLTELDNQIVCLVWSVWSNQQQWTLSYSLLDKTGEFTPFKHVVCPQNCLQCNDSSDCSQCQDGYNLMTYYKDETSFYSICQKKCDPFCEICDFGRCMRCKSQYYVGIDGVCIWNEFENKAIQINEFTQFSQVTPSAAKFKDGSILMSWSSNNEDEDSWGVFAQLLNNQGQKVGNNFRVSQSVFGAQHSPQVAVLEDDTAIITFIEGNPEKEAMIKGIRFNNHLDVIGNEQLFTIFHLENFQLNSYFINKIVSLKNGGFVIIWLSINQINLQFYDSASNLIIQTQILNQKQYQSLEVAVTTTELAILYQNTGFRYSVCIYSQEGVLLSDQELQGWDNDQINQFKLISISHYFALASIIQVSESQKVKVQFYNNQFSPVGNPIFVAYNSFNQYQKYAYFQMIDFFSLNDGALLILSESMDLALYRQFYIDINWQVTELLPFGFNFQQQFVAYQTKLYVLSNINADQYFIYCNAPSQNDNQYTINSVNQNIYIQRLSKEPKIVPIDQIVCSRDCRSCATQNTCSQCLNQYLLQDQQCMPQCESNCLVCLIPKICEICYDGYYQRVQGKCSPIPVNYQEPQVLLSYPFLNNLIDLNVLPNGQTILYTQQTLFDQQKEIFTLYIYQNNDLIKQISVQTNTLTTNYYSIYPFYIEENYYLLFHMNDGIKIIKYNAQQEEVLNTLLRIETIDTNINIWNIILNPIGINQYSLIYYKIFFGVFRVLYDESFNVIQKEQIFDCSQGWYDFNRIKDSIMLSKKDERYTFSNSLTIQQTKQVCLYSEIFHYNSCDIYQLSNGNKIQIISGTQNLKYYSSNEIESNYQVYYRILDSQDIPLTTEALVLENKFSNQQFAQLFAFQDSFTIIIEKPNYHNYENIEIYSQRFDNAGMKIGEPQFVLFNKGWQKRFYKQTSNGYIIYQEQRIYQQSLPPESQKVTIYYKQYDQFGNIPFWSTNKNCIANCDKCINSYYCEQCSQNYQLDTNSKCKLTCQDNCNQCTSFAVCDACNIGYKLVNGQCVKIICVSNCAQCLEDTTTTTTTYCKVCDDNYYLSTDNQKCLPHCPANCSQCSVPLECQTCAFGYVVTSDKKCQQENSSILDQIKNTTVGTPLMATFPDGSYILMWYQNGDNAGVYFQLYSVDNVKVGDPMKVTGNARRLLSQQSIIQNFYADIISIDYEFFVTWMDASSASTDVKLKKFSSDGTAQSQDILLGTHQKTDLQDIKIPCQIKKTPNNSLLIAYMAKSDKVSNDFSMFISSYDSLMNSKTSVQEIKKVNQLAAPSIVADENGIISLTYQSDGYVFVQQITEDGDLIDSPKAIADSNSINLRVTNLANGIMVFLWENKNLQLSQPQFILNYQLISKDLKTRSEVKSVGDIQIASLTPDIQSFNDGFIVAWKITDSNYKSIGIEFQIFDSMGVSSSQIIEVQIEGIYPQTPRIQIINENQFAVTWTAKNIDSDGTILGDGIFMQKYNKYGTLITDSSSSSDLCSYQCQSCQSPLVCLKCQYGFYLNKNNQCIMDCGAFCDSCEIPWTCQICKNGYQLNNNEACIETECSEGYFRNISTKLCEPKCPDDCEDCTAPDICTTCKIGYSLSDSSCISDTLTTEQFTIMTIVIIILAAAFISVSACSINLYCKYKKLLKEPSYCQVHPVQDINKSVSNVSCNVSVIRLRQNE